MQWNRWPDATGIRIPESERPILVNCSLKDPQWWNHQDLQPLTWEHIILDGVLEQQEELLPRVLEEKLAPNGWITGCLPLPGAGSRLSEVLKDRLEDKLFSQIKEGEDLFYIERAPLPQKEQLESIAHLKLVEWTLFSIEESLSPNAQWLAPWIKDQSGSWFHYVSRNQNEEDAKIIRALLQPEKLPPSIPWKRIWLIYRLRKEGKINIQEP